MQRVIRNQKTQLYLSEKGTWTSEFTKARKFNDTLALLKVALDYRALGPLEELLIAGVEPSSLDVALPLFFDSDS